MAMAQVQWNHFQNLGESASLAADHGGLPFLPNRKLIGASAIPPTPSDGLRNDAGRANQEHRCKSLEPSRRLMLVAIAENPASNGQQDDVRVQ